MEIWCFDNFLPEEYIEQIKNETVNINWVFSGQSQNDRFLPTFWYKELKNSQCISIFKMYIENSCKKQIRIDRFYMNGQAHSQSGFWHRDREDFQKNTYTMVYFLNHWWPEYGGHLMIRTGDDVFSFLPKENRAVIFHSHMEHMGLEPSCYCKTQRESIAVKFTIQE